MAVGGEGTLVHQFRSRGLALGVTLTLLLSLVPLQAASQRPSTSAQQDAAHGQAHAVMAALGDCPGHMQEVGDTGMCSHGTDPVPDFIEERGGPSRYSRMSAVSAETAAVACDGDGTSGKRVQAIYAYVSGRSNRRDSWLSSFRAWASNVDVMFQDSAAKTGGSRRLRWVTAQCELHVPAVAVTAQAEKSFSSLITELAAMGYDRNDRKYLIWIDSDKANTSGCGVATLWVDDKPTDNANNELANYARVDYVCWDFAEQHEMMHALGAVQRSAPNSTDGMHCTDEHDQMCYRDASDVSLRYVCPEQYEELFDCNNDDYFSTAPAAGSYLATHWNTANSDWLIAATDPLPPPNDHFSAAAVLSGHSGSVSGTTLNATQETGEIAATETTPPIDSVWHSWTATGDGLLQVDTCGSALDTTLAAWTGSAVNLLTVVGANDDDSTGQCGSASRIEIVITAGTTYHLSVDGQGSAEGAFKLSWRYVPPGVDLTAPVVGAPRAFLTAPQTLGSTVQVQLSWLAGSDESGIALYELQRRRGTRAWLNVPLPSPTHTSATVGLPTGSRFSFRLRATDAGGNTSPWVTTTTGKIQLLQETASSVSYSATFKRAALKGASGGYVRRSGVTGRTATVTFTGRSVGLVTTIGPQRGILEVRLDGGPWQRIDLYGGAMSTRRIVWAEAPETGSHTFQVRVTGAKNPASAGSRIDIDAFVVWQ